MRLPKYVISNAKCFNYTLPLRKKPVDMPVKYFEDKNKVSFHTYYIQSLVVKDYLADDQVKEHGYQLTGWGGGRSGLTDVDLTKLNKIFQFEGMGFAEYEWGDLGSSWKFLKENIKNVVFGEYEIFGKKIFTVNLNYHTEFMEKTLFGLVANNQFPVRITKQSINFHKVIQNGNKNFVGGWEIKSNYLFFVNKSRFLKFKKLLKKESILG
jgi:hypothetical protein